MPQRSKTTTQREVVVPETPNWEPLERAVRQWMCGQFMAMHEVVLRNGAHVCCYKHRQTRRSLHLDADLDAYLFSLDPRRPGRYERVSLHEAFARVVLLPEFEDGWIARGQFDRPWQFDDEGNEIERPQDEYYEPSYFELRMAEEHWERHYVGAGSDQEA